MFNDSLRGDDLVFAHHLYHVDTAAEGGGLRDADAVEAGSNGRSAVGHYLAGEVDDPDADQVPVGGLEVDGELAGKRVGANLECHSRFVGKPDQLGFRDLLCAGGLSRLDAIIHYGSLCVDLAVCELVSRAIEFGVYGLDGGEVDTVIATLNLEHRSGILIGAPVQARCSGRYVYIEEVPLNWQDDSRR